MITLSEQRKLTFNRLLKDIKGTRCCVFKVRQYIESLPSVSYGRCHVQTSDTPDRTEASIGLKLTS